jgi:uracil-DNA glycosylase family 4
MKLNAIAPIASSRRAIFLNEIGIGVQWTRRDAPPAMPTGLEAVEIATEIAADAESTVIVHEQARIATANTATVTAITTAAKTAEVAKSIQSADAGKLNPDNIAALDWRQLKAAVARCTACDLCEKRAHTVFGAGDEKAKWLFIGAGPDRTEDVVGEPFGGAAGKLLDNMMLAIGQKRGQNTYLTNLVKCRPVDAKGNDRAPTAQEVAACRPFLERQIALIGPAIIVALGKTAILSLRAVDGLDRPKALRGAVHRYMPQQENGQSGEQTSGIALVASSDPTILLRQPADKAAAWVDLCLARKTYDSLG